LATGRPGSAGGRATGGRRYNPGWHLALDLRNMLVVSECTARAALEREESRGGHTREDFPQMDPTWRKVNLVCTLAGDGVAIKHQPVPDLPQPLFDLFDPAEMAKYLTDEEMAGFGAAGKAH
jgi:succinate dehydrogenase flavoprotein subunit